MSLLAQRKKWNSTLGIFNNIIYTTTSVHAYYELPALPYTFTDNNGRNESMRTLRAIIEGVSSNVEGKRVKARIYIVPKTFDPDEWVEGFTNSTESMTGELPPTFFESITPEYNMLQSKSYASARTFLRIQIGDRSDATKTEAENLSGQIAGAAKNFIDTKILNTRDQEMSADEQDFWNTKEKSWRSLLEGYGCAPVHGYEIAALTRSILHPAMDVDRLPNYENWGEGDVYALSESEVKRHNKFMSVKTLDSEGLVATLAFQVLPPMQIPAVIPWMSVVPHVDNGTRSYMLWADMDIVSSQEVRKELSKYVKIAHDEQRDANKAGLSPLDVEEKVSMAEMLEHELGQSNEPWVYGSYFVSVMGADRAELSENIDLIKRAYRDKEILFMYPTGSPQHDLYFGSLPGETLKSERYIQRHPASIISGGMPTVSTTVGD